MKLRIGALLLLSLFILGGCSFSGDKTYQELSAEIEDMGFNCPIPKKTPKDNGETEVTTINGDKVLRVMYYAEEGYPLLHIECFDEESLKIWENIINSNPEDFVVTEWKDKTIYTSKNLYHERVVSVLDAEKNFMSVSVNVVEEDEVVDYVIDNILK